MDCQTSEYARGEKKEDDACGELSHGGAAGHAGAPAWFWAALLGTDDVQVAFGHLLRRQQQPRLGDGPEDVGARFVDDQVRGVADQRVG